MKEKHKSKCKSIHKSKQEEKTLICQLISTLICKHGILLIKVT
uniref:Uncharacterized protein n=1 Tax=Anguilla anguilla TaxID=7936 RepID=A0A0E9RJR5_ANGAN